MTEERAATPEVCLSTARIGDLVRRPEATCDARLLTEVRTSSPGAPRRLRTQEARIATRTLVRLVVAGILGVDPGDVASEARECQHCGGAHGPPRVPGSGLALGVARSRDLVVVASMLAPGGSPIAVGVDVEDFPPRADMPPADSILAPTELAERALAMRSGRIGDIDDLELLRVWTRKESVLKATGHGLAVPMPALELTARGRPLRLVHWDAKRAGRPAPTDPIALQDLTVDELVPHHAAAAVDVVGAAAAVDVVGAVAVVGATRFSLRRMVV